MGAGREDAVKHTPGCVCFWGRRYGTSIIQGFFGQIVEKVDRNRGFVYHKSAKLDGFFGTGPGVFGTGVQIAESKSKTVQ
jgi:hypothetical protein